MNIHISVSQDERRAMRGRIAYANGNLPKPDKGLKWGVSAPRRGGPSFKALNSQHFDLLNAPEGARLVTFAELDDGQCQWGFNHDGGSLFCGCAVDAGAERQFSRYCAHHVGIARNPEAAR